MRLRICLCLVIAAMASSVSTAQQWPRFRGLENGNVADDPALPDTWSETENVVWKTDIPGTGWSSPVVWDDHVFVTATIGSAQEPQADQGAVRSRRRERHARARPAEHRWMVYDVDFKTGKIRWQHELARGVPKVQRHIKNSFASETPVTDGERVYVYFGSIGLLAALDLNGTPRLDAGAGRLRRTAGVRHRRIARPAQRSPLRRQRQRRPSRSSPRSTSGPARRSGASNATRSRTGRRRSSGRTSCAPRS